MREKNNHHTFVNFSVFTQAYLENITNSFLYQTNYDLWTAMALHA